MPGISSTAACPLPPPRYDSWDNMMEQQQHHQLGHGAPSLDHHYQHYFYEDDERHDPDEDFFFKSTAPSEDIWKKFVLVPTPPMSPVRCEEDGLPSASARLLCPSLGDKLEWVSQFLGQEDEQQQQQQMDLLPCKLATAAATNNNSDCFGNLSSIIIQDCMWSGFSAGQQLERVVASSGCPVAKVSPLTGGTSATPRAQSAAADASCRPAVDSCVDPTAVLTFPIGGGSSSACKKQVSSGSESHSDSSEDDDDEDEEEIDVVTVEHKQQQQLRKPRRLVNARKPVTITVRADPLDPGMKRFHISIHQQQHNYAAPSPDTIPAPHEPPRKRVRQENNNNNAQKHQNSHYQHHHHQQQQPRHGHAPLNFDSRKCAVTPSGPRSESPTLCALSPTSSASLSSPPSPSSSSHGSPSKHHSHFSSPQSSDCEDTDKRKAHNFLERKRRNDLRSRFLSLRDEIPGLADCPKTPKVAILTRATEYLQQLHASERHKALERKQLKARQLQLLQRLAHLKRS